jgi:hypothetical protein
MSRENERVPWLVLAYRVPGDAVRLRMAAWRRLKTAGGTDLIRLYNAARDVLGARQADSAAAALVKWGEAFDSAVGADE